LGSWPIWIDFSLRQTRIVAEIQVKAVLYMIYVTCIYGKYQFTVFCSRTRISPSTIYTVYIIRNICSINTRKIHRTDKTQKY
jgi:hypothetical protein